jgi:diguanylate cyclase (GGDEF)-like protein
LPARRARSRQASQCFIDRFKLINDTFGHAVGDQMLERVAHVARAELRSADAIGRYGGEEFVIVLPMTAALQAHPVAERIREGVAGVRVLCEKGQAAVTVSIGIAEAQLQQAAKSSGWDDSVERLIQRADEAMYAAKEAGGNRTSTVAKPAELPGGRE